MKQAVCIACVTNQVGLRTFKCVRTCVGITTEHDTERCARYLTPKNLTR
jgi:hypothetical protein